MKLAQWPRNRKCEICEARQTKYSIMVPGLDIRFCPMCLSELRTILNAALILDDIVSIDHYAPSGHVDYTPPSPDEVYEIRVQVDEKVYVRGSLEEMIRAAFRQGYERAQSEQAANE